MTSSARMLVSFEAESKVAGHTLDLLEACSVLSAN